MPGSNVLLAQPGVLQGPEGAELIERMKAHAFIVLSQRVILGNAALTHDTRDELRLRHTLLLHEKLQGAIASSARRHLEHAGFIAFRIDNSADIQALQQSALCDALRQLLD